MTSLTFLDGFEPAEPEKSKTEDEPRVLTKDVARVLNRFVKPDEDDSGASVALIAERSNKSTRTVYRVLACSTPTISLDLADRLCLAAGSHLSACRIIWPDGRVESYLGGEMNAIL